jgi:YfdX protein
MNNKQGAIAPPTGSVWMILIVSCLLFATGCQSKQPSETPATPSTSSPPPSNSSDIQKQHEEAERQFRPDIESQRQQEEKQAQQSLDQDAIAAVQQTEQAVQDIAADKKNNALSDIEKATGKINILTARNSASALIPVSAGVVVIDAAPLDLKAIDQLAQLATVSVKNKDFPSARVLLATLVSEIRIRTSYLPLASYPAALSESARLLDQNKNQDAGNILLAALNTLVIVDHVVPLPLILAQAAISAADSQRQNKDVALPLLNTARNELNRSRALGYMSDDPDYRALDKQVSDLESAINGKRDVTTMFSQLRDKIAAFLKRQRDRERH